ncbi:MAG: hypothetical protein H7829_17115 [Magnetococcus sp. THC-1_WYH]
MSDETIAPDGETEETASVAGEQPADEVVEQSETDETPGDADDGPQDGEEEEIEFDFGGGNTYRVKPNATAKEVLEEAQRQFKAVEANYTRKQQEVAEERKALQRLNESVKKIDSLQGEALTVFAKGLHIKAEIDQLEGIDVSGLWQTNPDQARQISDMLSAKKRQLEQVSKQVAGIESEAAKAQTSVSEEVAQQTVATLEKRNPGISKKFNDIREYAAKQYGIGEAQIDLALKSDPASTELAYKAMLYDRMMTGKSSKPKEAAPVTGKKFKGAATAALDINKDAHRMHAADWFKQRQAQMARRSKSK